MKIKITDFKNGLYLPEHLAIVTQNIGKIVRVIQHDNNYLKTIKTDTCPFTFLIDKRDCIEIKHS